MPVSFVKRTFSGETNSERVIRGGACRVHVEPDGIRIECDDGTNEYIPTYMTNAGCIVYIGPDGKPHLECEKSINRILQRLRR